MTNLYVPIAMLKVDDGMFIKVFADENLFYVKYETGHSNETCIQIGYSSVNGALGWVPHGVAMKFEKIIKEALIQFYMDNLFIYERPYDYLIKLIEYVDHEFNKWLCANKLSLSVKPVEKEEFILPSDSWYQVG